MSAKVLGYWVLSGETLLDMLHQAANGADPDLLMMELYANSDVERPEEEP